MKTKHMAVFFVLATVAVACRNTDKINATTTDSSIEQQITDTTAVNRGADVASFMNTAAIAGMEEIETGKLAVEKSVNKNVKKFAEMMVKDHTKIAAELKTLAESKKISLPTALPAPEQEHIAEMKNLSGKDFDKHYMEMMTKGHLKALDLFKSAAVNGDVKVRNFASKTLRIIEKHFKTAGQINAGNAY